MIPSAERKDPARYKLITVNLPGRMVKWVDVVGKSRGLNSRSKRVEMVLASFFANLPVIVCHECINGYPCGGTVHPFGADVYRCRGTGPVKPEGGAAKGSDEGFD